MAREHGQKSEAICKDGGANGVAWRLITPLLLLITSDITSCSFHPSGLSCHLLSSDNEAAAFAMSPAQKSLIAVRLRRNRGSAPHGGLLTPPKQIREARSIAF